MFNWTTTTLINEIPENFIVNPLNKDGEPIEDRLRIGKHLFEKRWVESIRKAKGHKAELCKATIDMAKVKTAINDANVARLYVYVGLEGSEESIYANDWYRKGMPLSVSFANAAPADMAAAIVDTVNKFNVFTKVKKVLNVSANDSKLIIEGTHEHQRLMKISILVGNGEMLGEEIPVIEFEKNRKDSDAVIIDNVGVNGFGTYSQLLKDLRLPTPAHTGWNSVQKDEMPIVGAIYTQYIINYFAPSVANPSFTAVGNRSMSETTHVFWVKSDLIDAWEAALAAIDPDAGNLETIVVKEDKRFNNKKANAVTE